MHYYKGNVLINYKAWNSIQSMETVVHRTMEMMNSLQARNDSCWEKCWP